MSGRDAVAPCRFAGYCFGRARPTRIPGVASPCRCGIRRRARARVRVLMPHRHRHALRTGRRRRRRPPRTRCRGCASRKRKVLSHSRGCARPALVAAREGERFTKISPREHSRRSAAGWDVRSPWFRSGVRRRPPAGSTRPAGRPPITSRPCRGGGPLDHVAQLARVPRPRVGLERRRRLAREPGALRPSAADAWARNRRASRKTSSGRSAQRRQVDLPSSQASCRSRRKRPWRTSSSSERGRAGDQPHPEPAANGRHRAA